MDAAVVSILNMVDDCSLGRLEVRHLCPNVTAVKKRIQALLPLMRYPAFAGTMSFTVDGKGDAAEILDENSFSRMLEAAADMSNVAVSVWYTIPTEIQQSL